MPAAATSRRVTVNTEVGAKFTLQVINNPSSSSDMTKYYNFISNTFAAGHNSKNNNLIVTMSSRQYIKDIVFPSGGGSYVVKLIAFEGTEVMRSDNKIVISKTIEKQTTNSTLTFQAASLASPNNYQTTPTTTSTGALADTGSVNFDWTITNASTDAGGFGFILKDTHNRLSEKSLYIKTTADVVGTISGSTTVVVDSLTDIVVGSYIMSVDSGSLSGTPRITAIDTENKILTLDVAQSINNGVELTIKTMGITDIQSAIGVTLAFTAVTGGIGNSPRFIATALTKTVRDGGGGVTDAVDGDSTTISLSDTHGIAGGNIVTYAGVGVNNSSSNRVTSVTPDCPDPSDGTLDNDGKVVVELAQTLTAGTELRFEGSLKTVRIVSGISINGYPSANKTIYFNLDDAITVGAAS